MHGFRHPLTPLAAVAAGILAGVALRQQRLPVKLEDE